MRDYLLTTDLTALHCALSIATALLIVDVMQALSQRAPAGRTPLHWLQRTGLMLLAAAVFISGVAPRWEQSPPTWSDVFLMAALLLLFGATSILHSRLLPKLREWFACEATELRPKRH